MIESHELQGITSSNNNAADTTRVSPESSDDESCKHGFGNGLIGTCGLLMIIYGVWEFSVGVENASKRDATTNDLDPISVGEGTVICVLATLVALAGIVCFCAGLLACFCGAWLNPKTPESNSSV